MTSVVASVTVQEVQTYNLTVDGWHTYFVSGSAEAGAAGVWVHNTQQKSCGFNLDKALAEWNSNKDHARFRAGGDLANLRPFQKYLLGIERGRLHHPSLDKIDLTSVLPKGYDLDKDIWHGGVSFTLKGNGGRLAFKN